MRKTEIKESESKHYQNSSNSYQFQNQPSWANQERNNNINFKCLGPQRRNDANIG